MIRMTLPLAPPARIIRPSGIWDSRAPFHDYLRQHRLASQNFHTLSLSLAQLRREAAGIDATRSAKTFFRVKQSGKFAGRAWISLKQSFQRRPGEPVYSPVVGDVRRILPRIRSGSVEHAVISYIGLFETYTLCWALNYLLALLETGHEWSSKENKLCLALNPLDRPRGHRLPGTPEVINAFDWLVEGLSTLPHVRSGADGRESATPESSTLHAHSVVLFWRDYRNLLVHRSGVVSNRFLTRNGPLVEEIRSTFPYVSPLALGKRVELTDAAFRAVASTHFRVALFMNERLMATSGARRGHPFAPKPHVPGRLVPDDHSRAPLLVEGDHRPSYEWERSSRPQ